MVDTSINTAPEDMRVTLGWGRLQRLGFVPQFLLSQLRHPRRFFILQQGNMETFLEYRRYDRRLTPEQRSQVAAIMARDSGHLPAFARAASETPLKIFACWRHHNWENYNLLPALQAYGEVTHYDPRPDFDPGPDKTPDPAARAVMEEKVRSALAAGGYDVAFFYTSGDFMTPGFLQSLRIHGVPLINFSHDDIVKWENGRAAGVFRGNADIAACFDVYCTTSRAGVLKALASEAVPYYMPGGANPYTYKRLPGVKRDLDVLFIGARFYDRGEIVGYLEGRGISVVTHGRRWEQGSVTNEEQIALLNRARIVLGFSRYSNTDWMGIKGRDHEVPMTGAFHLVNDFPELAGIYKLGEEVETYRSRHELVDKIRYYLDHTEAREQIAARGRMRALRDHSWQVRLGELLNRLGLVPQAQVESVRQAILIASGADEGSI